jgi:transcriptional regulator with XRE-family HTH domain
MNTNWVQSSIAERMKEAAQDAGLNPAQIARKMGLSPATVYRWFEGERAPSAESVEAFAAAVDKPVAWIYQRVNEGEMVKELGEWVLAFARMVEKGAAPDVAFDAIAGPMADLSLRERRMLKDQETAMRRYLASLPADPEARRRILLQPFPGDQEGAPE